MFRAGLLAALLTRKSWAAVCPEGDGTCDAISDGVNLLQVHTKDIPQQVHTKDIPQQAHRPKSIGSIPVEAGRGFHETPKGKIIIDEDGKFNEYWLPKADTIDNFTTVKYDPPYRYYLMKEYTTDFGDASKYYKPNLIGKTFSVDFDFGPNGAGCGCNLNFYMVDGPVADPGMDGDYYCDGQCFDGLGCCAEWDMNEGNMFAQQITNHACSGKGSYPNQPDWECHKWGDPEVKTSPSQFGPSNDKDIDSRKLFTYEQIYKVENNQLEVITNLIQGDKKIRLKMGPGSDQLNLMKENIERGMAFVTGYWYADSMNWLDGDACGNGRESCSKAPVYLKNWRITTNKHQEQENPTSQEPVEQPSGNGQCVWENCNGHVMDGYCSEHNGHCGECGGVWCLK